MARQRHSAADSTRSTDSQIGNFGVLELPANIESDPKVASHVEAQHLVLSKSASMMDTLCNVQQSNGQARMCK